MTSINFALPLLQCTSCNKYYSHLLLDYYKFVKELQEMLDNDFDFEKKHEMNTTREHKSRNIYKLFIQPFYLYGSKEDKKLLNVKSIIAYALINMKQLTKDDFPFCEKIATKYKYCCTRMFLCDNSLGFK